MMALQTGKYSIAWFKLAEFVMRREKERALAIYRLLAHSLRDEAFAYQLEGDLLLSFGDDKAITSYAKAASLYEQKEEFREAVALYEHIATLVPDGITYLKKMFELYSRLGNEIKSVQAFQVLMKALYAQSNIEEIDNVLHNLAIPPTRLLRLYHEHLVIYLLEKKYTKDVYIYAHIEKAIMMLEQKSDKQLEPFMAKIADLNGNAYEYANHYASNR